MEPKEGELRRDPSLRAQELFLNWKSGAIGAKEFKGFVTSLDSKELYTLDKLMSEYIRSTLRLDD